MATNRELREQAEALAEEIGMELDRDLERMNNAKLIELVEDLKRQRDGKSVSAGVSESPPPEPVIEVAPEVYVAPAPVMAGARRVTIPEPLPPASSATYVAPEPETPVPPAERRFAEAKPAQRHQGPFPYWVAEGKSVTTKRGTRGAFQQVKASDFPDGQTTLNELVELGHVCRR